MKWKSSILYVRCYEKLRLSQFWVFRFVFLVPVLRMYGLDSRMFLRSSLILEYVPLWIPLCKWSSKCFNCSVCGLLIVLLLLFGKMRCKWSSVLLLTLHSPPTFRITGSSEVSRIVDFEAITQIHIVSISLALIELWWCRNRLLTRGMEQDPENQEYPASNWLAYAVDKTEGTKTCKLPRKMEVIELAKTPK